MEMDLTSMQKRLEDLEAKVAKLEGALRAMPCTAPSSAPSKKFPSCTLEGYRFRKKKVGNQTYLYAERWENGSKVSIYIGNVGDVDADPSLKQKRINDWLLSKGKKS